MKQAIFPQASNEAKLGIFGAGHLGQALAQGLLSAGLPKQQLALCHGGSPATQRKLAELGLLECVFSPEEVVGMARILFYTVRPQSYRTIAAHALRADTVLVSLLAGVPLERLPLRLPGKQMVRVMTSAPETIRLGRGIAAYFSTGDTAVPGILSALKLKLFALSHEEDLDAFTAFGPCLHIALTEWERMGRAVDEAELCDAANRFNLTGFNELLQWARAAQPRNLSPSDLARYLVQAATPGGVTEAILSAIRSGQSLSAALAQGVARCRSLRPS